MCGRCCSASNVESGNHILVTVGKTEPGLWKSNLHLVLITNRTPLAYLQHSRRQGLHQKAHVGHGHCISDSTYSKTHGATSYEKVSRKREVGECTVRMCGRK